MTLRTALASLLLAAALLAAAGGARADVIGEDDRIQITRTFEFPWRAVAQLEMVDETDEVVARCTGSLVGPDVVLTAGHCLYSPFTYGEAGYAARVRVVPGRNGDEEPFGSVWSEQIWVPDRFVESGADDATRDWGLVRLPEPVGETTGWFTVAQLRDETLLRPAAHPVIVGYPADQPLGTMWADDEPAFERVAADFLWHTIDVFKGQSGAGVFFTEAGSPYRNAIVGIHQFSRDLPDLHINGAQRLDEEMLQDLIDGCAALGCDLRYTSEPDPRPYKAFAPAIVRAP